jgi:hypothetical protein
MANTVYTSCGLHSNLKIQNSLARAVTVNNEVTTNSPLALILIQCRYN